MTYRVVFKYDLYPSTTVSVPEGGIIRHVDVQWKRPQIWIEVDPAAPVETRTFRTVATGEPMDKALDLTYVGTYLVDYGTFVFHVYEEKV